MVKSCKVARFYNVKGFFGSWLAEQLIANDYTYGDLANAINIHPGSLCRYVSMRSHPRYYIVKQICIFFHELNSEAIYQKVLDDIESEKDIPEYRKRDVRRFNGWLTDNLAERRLSIYKFAKLIEIPESTIKDHILERRYPNRPIVERYAEFFGVDVKEIYDRILYSKQYHKKKGEVNASVDI